jgi:hypothetical protein
MPAPIGTVVMDAYVNPAPWRTSFAIMSMMRPTSEGDIARSCSAVLMCCEIMAYNTTSLPAKTGGRGIWNRFCLCSGLRIGARRERPDQQGAGQQSLHGHSITGLNSAVCAR